MTLPDPRKAALLALLVLVTFPWAPAMAQRTPVVTNAVQVTPNPVPVRAHSSPQIAVNPKNGELVIVESDIRGDRQCKVRSTTAAAGAQVAK